MHVSTSEPFGRGEKTGWGLEPFEANDRYFMPEGHIRDPLDGQGLARLREAYDWLTVSIAQPTRGSAEPL